MNNSKNLHQLNEVKRYLMYFIFCLAVLSLILKTLHQIDINLRTSMAEIYIIMLSLLFIILIWSKHFGIKIKDDAIMKEKNNWTHMSFQVIIWGGLGLHLVSRLVNSFNFTGIDEVFASLFTLMGFIIAEMIAKKHASYLNHHHIYKDKKTYYQKILTRIGRLWLVALGYAVLIYSLSLSLTIVIQEVINLWYTIILIFLGISFQYFFLSIYEKIRYEEEQVIKRQESPFYMTKNAMLFGFSFIGFYMIRQIIMIIDSYLQYQNHSIISYNFDALFDIFRIWQIDFSMIGLILWLVIYRYLKNLHFSKPKYFPLVLIVIWLNFIYQIIIQSSYIFSNILKEWLGLAVYTQIQDTLLSFQLVFNIMNLGTVILIFFYLKKHLFPRRISVVMMFILPVIFYLLLHYVFSFTGIDSMISMKTQLIGLIEISLIGVYLCFILNKMCLTPIDRKEIKEEGSI